MKSFSRAGKFGKKNSNGPERVDSKRPSRGGFNRSEARDSGRPPFSKQSHKATCDKCGSACEVPFRPTGSKPIYCRDCFRTMEGSESPMPRQFGKREYPGSRHTDNFKKSEYPESANPDLFRRELEQINFKLDKILRALEND